MRRTIKKEILNIFSTLYEAHISVEQMIRQGSADDAISLLASCQETAVQIGNIIESSEGGEVNALRLLEEYCEAVYQVSLKAAVRETAGKSKKLLNKSLMKAENSVKSGIKAKYEIVFMPYKASMWDSLESVWIAANKDPDCDAYVVPIPYYDRNPDMSFGQLHYEGGDFPDYVPIVHYDSYKLDVRKPDIIYIHNPYDEFNYVTSVDPRFYSRELKKNTDCLVYIPYFVVEKWAVADTFSILPGCVNADRVIIDSECLRNSYVNYYFKSFGYKFGDPQKKFLTCGSPKYDKVIRSSKEDYSLPEEWSRLINGKKIFLYLTSVTPLFLDNVEQYLDKLRSVMAFFAARDDVLLWWRPHPLALATFKSVRPDLLERYSSMVKAYIQSGTGIYDDSSELHRAIAYSDAYYGDESSVVELYKATGKPLMLQHVYDIKYEDKSSRFPVWTNDFVVDGDDIWFMHWRFSILLKYDMKSGNTSFVTDVPFKQKVGWEVGTSIIKSDNKLFLFSTYSSYAIVYDILTGSFTEIPFLKDEKDNMSMYCITAVWKGQYVYCIPVTYKYIVAINIDSYEVKYINIKDFLLSSGIGIISTAVLVGDLILIANYKNDNDCIGILDTRKMSFSIFSLNTGRKYCWVLYFKDKLYLLDQTEGILDIFDLSGHSVYDIPELKPKTVSTPTGTTDTEVVIYSEDQIAVDDYEKTVIFTSDGDCIETKQKEKRDRSGYYTSYHAYRSGFYNDKLYRHSMKECTISEISNNSVRQYLLTSNDEIDSAVKEIVSGDNAVMEGDGYTLNDFIHFDKSFPVDVIHDSGALIHKTIKETILDN